MTHGLGPGKPGPTAAKPITPPYVENNYRIEVKITFMLIAYLVLLCEFFWEFSIFQFCRPLVDIYWHPLLKICQMEKKLNSTAHVSLCLRTLHEGCRVLTNISDCTLFFCWEWIWDFCHLQPEDLIKALMELENSASQDAVVREKIANLPAEVQDVSLLEKIEGTQPK